MAFSVNSQILTLGQMENKPSFLFNNGSFQMRYSCVYRSTEYIHFAATKGEIQQSKNINILEEKYLPKDCPSPFQKVVYDGGKGDFVQLDLLSQYYLQKNKPVKTSIIPIHKFQKESGLWGALDKRLNCARLFQPVELWVGVIWGGGNQNEPNNEIHVPESLFRIHRYGNTNRVFAWIIPNDDKAVIEKEMQYRVIDENLYTQQYIESFDINYVSNINSKDPYVNTNCEL